MHNLLKDIYIDCINLNFDFPWQAEKVIALLGEIAEENETDPKKMKGSVDVGPLRISYNPWRLSRRNGKSF